MNKNSPMQKVCVCSMVRRLPHWIYFCVHIWFIVNRLIWLPWKFEISDVQLFCCLYLSAR